MQNFLAGQGLNADVLANDVRKASGTASDALTQAKPTVDSTVVTLSRSSPALLAEYALGAVALYYFVRPSHLAPPRADALCVWYTMKMYCPFCAPWDFKPTAGGRSSSA